MKKMFVLLLMFGFGDHVFGQRASDWSKLPKSLWRFSTRSQAPFTSSPVIDNTTVYVGSLDSCLYAIDSSNGKEKWKIKTGGPIRSKPRIVNDDLYFYSGDGALYKVDKKSSVQKWKFQTLTGFMGDRTYDLADPYQSSPAIDANTVFVGSSDGRIYAVDAATGQQRWSFQTNDIVHTTPYIYEGKLLAGSYDGFLYCLDKTSGELIWKFKALGNRFFPKGEMMGNPVAAKGIVYVGSRDYNLYAIDASNGYCHWVRPFSGGWALNIVPHDSIIYVGTSDDKAVYAFGSKGGRQFWKIDVKFNILGDMAFDGKNLLAGTLMGKLFCIDVKTAQTNWVYSTDAYEKNHLVYFKPDDTFRDDVFNIVKTPLDALTAYVRLGGMYSSPAITPDKIVIATYDGSLHCLGYK